MAILKRAMGSGRKGVTMADGTAFTRDWGGIQGGFFGHFSSETYASSYPYIRAISSEYMTVLPYAIDGNGKPIDHPVIDALFHPNREDSVVAFAEKVAVSTLTRNKTYLLVWRKQGKKAMPGGDFRKDTIAGFTFLERPMVERKNGHTYYKVGTDTYDDNEVLVLPGGVNPASLYAGYSPNEAARRWVKLDDYIADYQAGFFENGAVPAGVFTVSAASVTDYDDTVNALEAKHRGAGKNNNVTYAHKLISDTGSAVATSIEWTPMQQANKDIGFKDLFEQTNRRIEITYGVPGVVMGVDGEAKYDNAEVGEATFAKRAVRPLLLRNYTQMTHEINRITGGFGAAITFDYEIPAIADAEKVKAETKQIESDIIAKYTSDPYNYSLESVINAFNLSNSYKLLRKGEEALVIDNDKPEVDEGSEVDNAPNPEVVGGNYYLRSTKAVSARQFSEELESLVPEETGYAMLNTQKLDVLSVVEGAEADLVPNDETEFGNLPGENTPHLTILDGILNQPSEIKDIAEKLYEATPVSKLTIDEIGVFEFEESKAIVAKIELTDELEELRENFTLIPHASKFSTYLPHVTLAYLKKDADADKWINALTEAYEDKEIEVTGLYLGEERTGEAKSTNPKALNSTKQLSLEELEPYETQVQDAILGVMATQIERTINQTKAIGDVTEEDNETLLEEILAILLLLMLRAGQSEYQTGINLLIANDRPTINAGTYVTPTEVEDAYRAYLSDLVQSYNLQTQTAIQSVLAEAQLLGWDAQTLRTELEALLVTEAYRAKRLAETEGSRVAQIAAVAAITALGIATSNTFNKVWRTTSLQPCPFCIALEGKVVETRETFIPLDGTLEAADGAIMINNFVSMEHPPLHPNCRCILQWELA